MMVVYLITNSLNGKCYIGWTATDVVKRFKAHCDTAKRGSPTYFHKAIRAHGEQIWSFNVLAESSDLPTIKQLEKEFIARYGANQRDRGYNLTAGGDGILGFHHSAETRMKMSIAHKGNQCGLGYRHTDEARQKMSLARKGKPFSKRHIERIGEARRRIGITPEHRRRINEGKKGKGPPAEFMRALHQSNIGKRRTEETRLKMSLASKGRPKSEEARRNMSASFKGRIPWNKGLKTGPLSLEVRRKMSKVPWNKNQEHSQETKQKMKDAWIIRRQRIAS